MNYELTSQQHVAHSTTRHHYVITDVIASRDLQQSRRLSRNMCGYVTASQLIQIGIHHWMSSAQHSGKHGLLQQMSCQFMRKLPVSFHRESATFFSFATENAHHNSSADIIHPLRLYNTGHKI